MPSLKMPKIFISYSHQDAAWLGQLLKFLSGGLFQKQDLWSDLRIAAGASWFEEIQKAMEEAHVAILLISQDFLNSKFIMSEEVVTLLKRRKEEGVSIFPLLLRYSTWDANASLASMQARPQDGKPLDGRPRAKRERELAAFATEISLILGPSSDQRESEGYRGKGEEPAQKRAGVVATDTERRSRESVAPETLADRGFGLGGGRLKRDLGDARIVGSSDRIGTDRTGRGASTTSLRSDQDASS